jgi:hypothetical protein
MLRRIAIARQLLRMQVTSGCFMRLLDEDADASCNRVTCYLTRAEAQELRDSLEALLRGGMERHEHVSSADFGKEITVCLYDPADLSFFGERSRRIIEEDR